MKRYTILLERKVPWESIRSYLIFALPTSLLCIAIDIIGHRRRASADIVSRSMCTLNAPFHIRWRAQLHTHVCIFTEIGTGEKQHTRKSIFHARNEWGKKDTNTHITTNNATRRSSIGNVYDALTTPAVLHHIEQATISFSARYPAQPASGMKMEKRTNSHHRHCAFVSANGMLEHCCSCRKPLYHITGQNCATEREHTSEKMRA